MLACERRVAEMLIRRAAVFQPDVSLPDREINVQSTPGPSTHGMSGGKITHLQVVVPLHEAARH